MRKKIQCKKKQYKKNNKVNVKMSGKCTNPQSGGDSRKCLIQDCMELGAQSLSKGLLAPTKNFLWDFRSRISYFSSESKNLL